MTDIIDLNSEIGLDVVRKLSKDVRVGGAGLSRDAARFIVDTYYRFQEHRIALYGQARALDESENPSEAVMHFATQTETLERQMVGVLDAWTDAHAAGLWAKSIIGIGPVLSAGLLAHIDITKAHTAGAIWRFAGLDPSVVWLKGEKRPFNADLKVLCWKIGDSFVKQKNRDSDYYGHLYAERKIFEVERNESGGNATVAAHDLEHRKITDSALKARLKTGMLPDGRIDLRARRWATKMFLSHWQEIAYAAHFGELGPAPYVMVHLSHAHYRPVPNQPDWFKEMKANAPKKPYLLPGEIPAQGMRVGRYGRIEKDEPQE